MGFSRFYSISVIILGLLTAAPAWAQRHDFIYDFDYTLFQPIPRESPAYGKPGTIVLDNGECYRPRDGQGEQLRWLKRRFGDDAQLWVDSGGSQGRNVEALRKWLPFGPGQPSALELIGGESHVRSSDSQPPSIVQVGDRKIKDLPTTFHGEIPDFRYVTWFDDNARHALPEQLELLVWLQETFEYQESFVPPAPGAKYLPKTAESWARERNLVAYETGVILETARIGERDGIPDVEARKKIDGLYADGRLVPREDARASRLYRIGEEALLKEAPALRLVPLCGGAVIGALESL